MARWATAWKPPKPKPPGITKKRESGKRGRPRYSKTETRFTYNASGYMTTSTVVMGDQLLTTTYEYTFDDNLTSITDPEGITTI